MLKRAQAKGKLAVSVHNLRDWTHDAHRSADDKPFGGGPGMVMKVEPICEALGDMRSGVPKPWTVLLTPQGRLFDQRVAREFAGFERLILVCGHYEGVDERVRSLVDDEISIGDYILTGGEIPALVIVDAVARLIPGVLGHSCSAADESFENGLLEYPHYTRPAQFRSMAVPAVLLSGDHTKIARWRRDEALKRTKARRPDLLKRMTQKTGKRKGRTT